MLKTPGYSLPELQRLLTQMIDEALPKHYAATTPDSREAAVVFGLLVELLPKLLADNNRKLAEDIMSRINQSEY